MTPSCKVRRHDPNYSQIFRQHWSDRGVKDEGVATGGNPVCAFLWAQAEIDNDTNNKDTTFRNVFWLFVIIC
jgi:hypothetical protein